VELAGDPAGDGGDETGAYLGAALAPLLLQRLKRTRVVWRQDSGESDCRLLDGLSMVD
jgi:hypothetical protein